MTNEFNIEWNDIDFTKQDEIMETLKKYELTKFKEEYEERKQETPDKWPGFMEFMCEPTGYDLDKEDFSTDLDMLLEEQAQARIDEGFKHISVMI